MRAENREGIPDRQPMAEITCCKKEEGKAEDDQKTEIVRRTSGDETRFDQRDCSETKKANRLGTWTGNRHQISMRSRDLRTS